MAACQASLSLTISWSLPKFMSIALVMPWCVCDVPVCVCEHRWCSAKESTYQRKRRKRDGFDPWVRKISCSRKWQPTPVFLPGNFQGQKSLAGYSSSGCKELDMTEHTHNTHRRTCIHACICTHNSFWTSGIQALQIVPSQVKTKTKTGHVNLHVTQNCLQRLLLHCLRNVYK